MSSPLVSVITPAYNAAPFVGDTIRSVQRQTYPNWELIVVDDCSTDTTAGVVRSFAAEDSRVRYFRHSGNGGPARARDTGLKLAKGRFIAFIDSDDVWLPEKLERQLAFMDAKGAAFSYTAFRRINRDASGCGRPIGVPPALTYSQLLKNTAITTSTVLVDKLKTGEFSMTITYYDDYALWLELLRRGFVAYGLQEDLVRYRVVGRSVSRNKLRSALWVWRTYRDIEKLSAPYAFWCFSHYAWNACLKYRSF